MAFGFNYRRLVFRIDLGPLRGTSPVALSFAFFLCATFSLVFAEHLLRICA